MNLHRISRIAKVSIGSAAMVFGLASCSLDYVVGYVYVTTNKSSPGVIDQYSIDFQSGALASIGTPVAAGNNPVRLVADPTGKFVYVVNQGDSTVQEFAVQGDGTLVSKNTYPTGNSPTAVAIDPQGKFLYVTFTYLSGVAGGGVSIFPVNADNSLGTATTQPVGTGPVGVSVSYFNHFVYVLDQGVNNRGNWSNSTTYQLNDVVIYNGAEYISLLSPNLNQNPGTASTYWSAFTPGGTPQTLILGFAQNTSTGALTPVPGTTITTAGGRTVATGYAVAGVPSAIAEEPTSRFLYVTDQADNYLIGYDVAPNGSLTAMINGPFPTGLFPVALTIDPTGSLLYVVNYNSRTVSPYALNPSTGTPSSSVGTLGTQVGVGPNCVAIDPALGTFLYTSDNLDNTVTGERLSQNTGALTQVENSPFNSAGGQPTCLAVVANGAHATQAITP